jgi:NADH-quinone oxidoreductase subunit M
MLKTLLLIPLLGAFALALLPTRSAQLIRRAALTVSAATLGWSLWLASAFDPSLADVQLLETHAWNPRLGSAFTLGVDGISLPLVWLTALLAFVAVLASGAIK